MINNYDMSHYFTINMLNKELLLIINIYLYNCYTFPQMLLFKY